MSSSAWVLMDDECDCGGPPPRFHLPPPPVPPDLPCDLLDTTCPAQLNIGDAEFKRIGSFPSLAVIISCTLLSAVILLVIGAVLWRKRRRKGPPQTKDFDMGPSMPTGNGLLYEDLSHARPRPPIATPMPSIEMLDVNHHGLGNNGSKLDFSYFLNPPPIYEELPDLDGGQSDRNNGPSEDEFAEDELSVIDVPVVNQCHPGQIDLVSDLNMGTVNRYGQAVNRNSKSRAQSLNRKRNGRNAPTQSSGGSASGGGFKSQRSLDRHNRNNGGGNKYPGTNPRPYVGLGSGRQGMNPNSGMLILSDHTGIMKIPPHLVAVLTESALCNGGVTRPYEVIPASGLVHPGNNLMMLNGHGQQNGVYPSSRSSGSSYGDGSSSSSNRVNPNGTSAESSSFDSGIGQHSLASCINSPAYDQTGLMQMQYSHNPYEYSPSPNGTPTQFLTQQHPNFRRMRMTVSDRDHPLYSNHLLN